MEIKTGDAFPIEEAEEQENLMKLKDEEFRKIRLAFLNILEDTEEARKSAEKERNKTLAIIKNLTDGLLLLDDNNRIKLVSPAAEISLEQSAEKLIGQNVFKITSESIDIAPLLQELSGEGKNEVKRLFKKEIKLGEKFYLEATTVFLETGLHDKSILLILHDISRDKLIEAMKTEFVSVAAHQLRTPLSAIKWTIRMILDGDVGKISADQRDLLEKTYASNERMITLINDLLNVTRIEEGRFLYKPEPMQLEDLVDAEIKNHEDALQMKKIRIKLDMPKELLPEVSIDKEKMGIVVQNLIENAIKYTQEGGLIGVSLGKDENNVIFKIKDSGVGIPEDQKERIFSKFFRGSNVIKMETEGSGLGLYTTKNIVEAHRGKIWFESKEGEGTEFYFTLPAV
ncbi:MAG: HAMP domain-containing sensor histidine kinase [Candidatus Pacebacteria bacterium]|nr:HAMP domain-containing sensor histidine kinase [Candidatus Paceibacterota bacterium]